MNDFELKCLNNSSGSFNIVFVNFSEYSHPVTASEIADVDFFFEYKGIVFNNTLSVINPNFTSIKSALFEKIYTNLSFYNKCFFEPDFSIICSKTSLKDDFINNLKHLIIEQVYNFYEIRSNFTLDYSANLHSEEISLIVHETCSEFLNEDSSIVDIFEKIISLCEYDPLEFIKLQNHSL